MMLQRYLDDFTPGEVFKSSPHTLSDKHFAAFAAMTGDAHPIHYDPDYARLDAQTAWQINCSRIERSSTRERSFSQVSPGDIRLHQLMLDDLKFDAERHHRRRAGGRARSQILPEPSHGMRVRRPLRCCCYQWFCPRAGRA